ncbi:MAG: hypothetical protein HQK56_21145, partial [Deltaproteobacteria bacterium]|nr:hypothetical protein [Deltaproteobacteria bacterium]
RIVAKLFVPNPHQFTEINHIDGEQSNNDFLNIEWCSRSYNLNHRDKVLKESKGKNSNYINLNWAASRSKWQVRISDPDTKKRILIGYYDEELEAAKAYDSYILDKGWHLSPYNKPLNFQEWVPQEKAGISFELIYLKSKTFIGDKEVGNIEMDHPLKRFMCLNLLTFNSYNWNQHKQVYSIYSRFLQWSKSISISSCRVDAIARDPGLIRLLQEYGSSSITVAIEGISKRLRNFFQKSLLDEDLLRGMDAIISKGFTMVKLYYIYTGYETDEDLQEFETFLLCLEELCRKHNRPQQQFRFSFTPLLSTNNTPIQYQGSRVSRGLKSDDGLIYRIKQLIAVYGWTMRTSINLDVFDIAQMIEFADRRSTPFFLYASLNGLVPYKVPTYIFYKNEKLVSKKKYDSLLAAEKVFVRGNYYQADVKDKFALPHLYFLLEENQAYPEYTPMELMEHLAEYEGKVPPEFLTQYMGSNRWEELIGCKLAIVYRDSHELVYKYPNGNEIKVFNPTMSNKLSAVESRVIFTQLTNGITIQDLIADKDPLYVFPAQHVRFHMNQHLGQNARQYLTNAANIYNTYCHKENWGDKGKCIACASCTSVNQVKSITEGATLEYGDTHFPLVADVIRNEICTLKVFVEIRIDQGPYSAMRDTWLKHAAIRSLLMASEGELTKCVIFGKNSTSKQLYGAKQ